MVFIIIMSNGMIKRKVVNGISNGYVNGVMVFFKNVDDQKEYDFFWIYIEELYWMWRLVIIKVYFEVCLSIVFVLRKY